MPTCVCAVCVCALAVGAGFALCNQLGKRHEITSLLHATLPPLLAFFFFSTGTTMRIHALRRCWPIAIVLFLARLASIWLGVYLGGTVARAECSGRRAGAVSRGYRRTGGCACDVCGGGNGRSGSGDVDMRCCGWAAYVTQAGITLGLSDEIAASFPTWGPGLQASLVSAIVLSQLAGPPLLKYALTLSGEAHAQTVDAGGGPDPHGSVRGDGGTGADDDVTNVTDAATGPCLRADRPRTGPRRSTRPSHECIGSDGADISPRGSGGLPGAERVGGCEVIGSADPGALADGELSEDEANPQVVSFGLRGAGEP